MGHIAWLALALGALAPPPVFAQTDNALAEGTMINVVSLVSARLALARQTAAWAWHGKETVAAALDERATEPGITLLAPRYGLDASFVQVFFADLKGADNQIQRQLLQQWSKNAGPPLPDPSVIESNRQTDYQLTQALLVALARVQSVRTQDDCPVLLSRAVSRWTVQMATLQTEERDALPLALQHLCTQGGMGGTA